MRFITIRDLRSKSAQIQRELPKEKEMVLTSNGKPIAILAATSAERIEEIPCYDSPGTSNEGCGIHAKALCGNRHRSYKLEGD